MIHFEIPETQNSIVKIIGIGGGGSNAVTHMQTQGVQGVDLIICNTDSQALSSSSVSTKIQLGPYITQGLGAGANPEVGQKAAEESVDELKRILESNTKMVFITAGMGGGTGTGGAPIVAKLCKEMGILTVAIVTTPFFFEGKKRMQHALEGIQKLKETVDTIIVISNDKLREQCGDLTFIEAFSKADGILATAANCITSVINKHDRVNTDFADVNTVMRNGGVAILGRASASGADRAMEATEEALVSPLLNNNDIKGAKWLLVNIASSESNAHTMDEITIIESYLSEQAGEDCNVILGMGIDNSLDDKLSVTIIATGFTQESFDEPHSQRMKELRDKNKTILSLDDDEALPEVPTTAGASEPQMHNSIQVEPPTRLTEEPTLEKPQADTEPVELSLQDLTRTDTVEVDNDDKIILHLDEDEVNEINVGEMIYGDPNTASIDYGTGNSIEDKLSSEFQNHEEQPQHNYAQTDPEPIHTEEVSATSATPDSPYETLYEQYGIPKQKGVKMLTEEERRELLDFEMQKQQLENRAKGLFSLKSDIVSVPPKDDSYMHDVPAIERKAQDGETPKDESSPLNEDEGYLSGYRVTNEDINNNKLISSINNFLHGKKPD